MSKRNKQPNLKKQQASAASVPHPAFAKTAKVWSVLIAIGSVGGFLSLAEKLWAVTVGATKPDVRPLNLSADPFSLPFVIRNQSTIFTMADATWICGVDSAGGPRGGSMSNIGIIYGKPTDILPGRSLLARCPIGGAGESDATIVPIVKYKTFWVPREYNENSFTWLSRANPPQWIEGRPLK